MKSNRVKLWLPILLLGAGVCHAQQAVCIQPGVYAGTPPAEAPGQIACGDEDKMPPVAVVERAAGVIVAGAVYTERSEQIVGSAQHFATATGKVKEIPVYGSGIEKLGFIGKATGQVHVPTSLSRVPFIGPKIHSIPVVGGVVAGTPPPWLVAGVALDSFYMPKVQPCGYTESSMFTQTDFNSPPRLRSYVNYLAPLPYTHPPIYAPGTLNLNHSPNTPPQDTDNAAVNIEQ